MENPFLGMKVKGNTRGQSKASTVAGRATDLSFPKSVKRITTGSSSKSGGCTAVFQCLIGRVASIIAEILLFILSITSIIIGSLYVRQCEAERYIPIYLIVTGCVSLLQISDASVALWRNNRATERKNDCSLWCFFMGVVEIFLFAWIIAGCCWIYNTWNSGCELQVDADVYVCPTGTCNADLLLSAFILITITLLMIAFIFICGCCYCLHMTHLIIESYEMPRPYDV